MKIHKRALLYSIYIWVFTMTVGSLILMVTMFGIRTGRFMEIIQIYLFILAYACTLGLPGLLLIVVLNQFIFSVLSSIKFRIANCLVGIVAVLCTAFVMAGGKFSSDFSMAAGFIISGVLACWIFKVA